MLFTIYVQENACHLIHIKRLREYENHLLGIA